MSIVGMDIKDKETIAYATIPRINELRCIICEIDYIEVVQNSLAKSIYHWQILKCRLIVHIFPEVIVSPIPGTDNSLFVIATDEFLKTGKLQENLRALNMLFGLPQPVTVDAYAICLQYTIECKLAPKWNRVAQYYVQGQNFYIPAEELNALKMQISIDDGRATFRLQSRKIKIPFVYLEDFYLLRSSIVDFLIDNNGFMNLADCSQLVYVLPNMDVGKVVSVSKKIPSSCPFKDHIQLRRHWKNMYGYRLPKNAEGTVYYEIKFPIVGSNNFIYPNTCVASKQIQIISCYDTDYIISQFIHNIHVTIPEIFDKQLHISCNHNNKNVEFFSLNEYESSIQYRLSQSEDQESLSIRTNVTDISKVHQSEFSSNYERWLLADSSKSTHQILKPTKLLSTVDQIHKATKPIATNNNIDVKIDDIDIINPIKTNVFKYNDAQKRVTFPCDDTQTNYIFSNSIKLGKTKFQTLEPDIGSFLYRNTLNYNKPAKSSNEVIIPNKNVNEKPSTKCTHVNRVTRSSKKRDKRANLLSNVKHDI